MTTEVKPSNGKCYQAPGWPGGQAGMMAGCQPSKARPAAGAGTGSPGKGSGVAAAGDGAVVRRGQTLLYGL